MSDSFDPFQNVRRLAGDPEPTPEEERAALARLQRAITAERAGPGSRRRRIGWRWAVPTTAVALVAAFLTAVVVLQPGPADATLDEIVYAARAATPLDIPEGSFIHLAYDQTNLGVEPGEDLGLDRDHVGYLRPAHVDVWYQPSTGFYQRRSVAGEPFFFDDEVRTAWEASGGAARDQVGEVVTERVTGVVNDDATTDWPTDPKLLRAALEARITLGGLPSGMDVALFENAVGILRTGVAGPSLRAAIAGMLAGLPLDLVEDRPDGGATLAITYELNGDTSRYFIDLGPDGILLGERRVDVDGDAELNIPPGTTVSDVTYQPPEVVTDLPDS